jgi:Ca2+-binding RTX toxin-like protein
MSKTIISADTTTTILADTADHTWIVNAGVNIDVAGHGFNGNNSADGRVFDIKGHVTSTADAGADLFIGSSGNVSGTKNTSITVESTGVLTAKNDCILGNGIDFAVDNAGTISSSAFYGIALNGSGLTINNTGSVSGSYSGIYSASGDLDVTNSGHIESSDGSGIGLYHSNTIENSGTIEITNDAHAAISWYSDGAAKNVLDNSGKISAPVTAIYGNHGSETVINSGKIVGNVDLNGGDDVFRNDGGTLNGKVDGGGGDDTYTIDNASINLVELKDDGNDTVKSSVSYMLAANFEKLILTGDSNINGNGNALDNDITGNGGNNRLSGGLGDDDLTGGKGSDIFVFKDNFGQDTIHDFAPGTDRIDLSDFSGVKNFTDLMANHATKSDGDVIIHAGTDHLILDHVAKGDLHASDFIF